MSQRPLLLLFAGALLVRLVVLFAGPWSDPARATFGDSSRYLTLGANLREHGRFGLAQEEPARAWSGLVELREKNGTQPPRDSHGLIPEVLRTPGYPLVIAAAGALGDVRLVLLLQCALGSLAAVGVVRIGQALGLSPRPALVAGIMWAAHPGLVVRDAQFMTESLFNSLGVLGLWAAACGPRGWKGWLLTGAAIGYGGLVRPLAALYLPAACAFAARRVERRRWLAVLVIGGVAVLPSVAWAARNAATGNGFRVSTVGEITLFYYFAGYTISEERGADWVGAWPERSDELLKKLGERVGPGDDVFKKMRGLALEELKARPGVTAKVLAKSWVKLYVAHSVGEAYQMFGAEYHPQNVVSRYVLREPGADQRPFDPGAAVLPLLWSAANGLIALAALVGTVVALRRWRFGFAVPLALTVALFTVATMSQGMERFRSPFMAALFLLAVAPWGLPRREAPPATLPAA